MFPGYRAKIRQLYGYQAFVFRAIGALYYTSNSSQFRRFLYETYFTIAYMWIVIYNLGVLINFIIIPTIVEKIVKVFFALAPLMAAMFKLGFIKTHNPIYKENIAFLYKNVFVPADAIEEAIFEKTIKISTLVRDLYASTSFMSLLYGTIHQVATNPRELLMPPYIPFEYHSLSAVVWTQVIAFITVGLMCATNIYFDSWCVSFLLFARTQLDILEHRLQLVGRNTLNNSVIRQELKKCINHHAEIVDFVQVIQQAISLPLSIQIFCSVLVLCSTYYIIFLINDISIILEFIIYGISMFAQIFIMCFYSSEVTAASGRLSFALYTTNWMYWDKVNRKLALMMMLRFQQPLVIRSINSVQHFDLSTFTTIVNTSYSYFALLKGM